MDPVLLNFRAPWSFRTENLNALKSVFVHYRLDQLHQAYTDAQKPQSPIRSVDRTLDDCVLIVSCIVTGVGDVGTTPMGKNECYRDGQFENAERLFAALAESEGDLPSVVLKDRCGLLRVSPPEHWDGVFRLENK